ncbi:hypothetical protein BAE44_0013356, partial [Dichanthelium oligosanthes]
LGSVILAVTYEGSNRFLQVRLVGSILKSAEFSRCGACTL